jgi:hypothetical protein
MKNLALLSLYLLLLPALFACSAAAPARHPEGLGEPEKVQLFTVPLTSLSRAGEADRAPLTGGFPFVSQQPEGRFKGKFPPSLYADLEKRGLRARELGEVDFWRLKNDPALYDVIYLKGMLLGEFKPRGTDLLESIAFSYNIPAEKLAILRDWVARGGILWLEPSISVSSYDYQFKKMDDVRLNRLLRTLSGMTLEGHRLNVITLRARRSDQLHVEPLTRELNFGQGEKPGEIGEINSQVRSLLLQQKDYIGIYLSVQGTPIVSSKGQVFASFVASGRGKIITLAPFDFLDSYHDGELFRILLLTWALEGKK